MTLDTQGVQAVFSEAVQYADSADRAVLRERECSADTESLRRVATLLRAHDEYDDFLKEPTFILLESASGTLGALREEMSDLRPLRKGGAERTIWNFGSEKRQISGVFPTP